MIEMLRKLWKARQHTSRDHNFLSSHWNFNFFRFMKTRHPELSRCSNIASIWVQKDILMPIRSQNWKSAWGRNCWCQPGSTWCTNKGWRFGSCLGIFLGIFFFLSFVTIFSHHISLPKNMKNHKNFLILLSSPKIQGSVHTLHLPFLGSIPWIWGIGVWM